LDCFGDFFCKASSTRPFTRRFFVVLLNSRR
jgi:hypothetical protein